MRAADRVDLGRLVGPRIRVVLPVRVAGVGGLDERELGRAAVHLDRGDRHVRAGRLVRRPALEVQAEAGQALGGPVGQHDVVARQELVGWSRRRPGRTSVCRLVYPPLPVSGYRREPGGASVCAPAEQCCWPCAAAVAAPAAVMLPSIKAPPAAAATTRTRPPITALLLFPPDPPVPRDHRARKSCADGKAPLRLGAGHWVRGVVGGVRDEAAVVRVGVQRLADGREGALRAGDPVAHLAAWADRDQ